MMVFSMVIWMSLGHKLSHSSKYVGEGMSASITGLALGFAVLVLGNIFLEEGVTEQLLTFNHSNFFVFFLPPIILYAGLSVRKKAFFRNLPTIASLGILGTYIAFAVIAFTLYGFSKVLGITLADCLALGAIFATTDSVAVLQVLEPDRAPLLFNMVFGEGVINDATTVALLRTVQRLGIEPKMNAATVGLIFGKFLYLFLASLLMGLLLGLFSALLLKNFNVSQTPQAVGVIGMVAYLSYLVGDYIGLSGIVTLFCCSVTMSHYALHNISKAQRAGTMSAFETLSFLSEGAIFVYVGLDALDPMKWKNTYIGQAMGLFGIVLVLLLVSRAVFLFPILAVHNFFCAEKLPFRHTVVAWWAGAMRGAVSVALVYLYYDPDGNSDDVSKSSLISATLTVVLFSTLAYGAITKPMLDFLLGPEEHAEELHHGEGIELMSTSNVTSRAHSPKIGSDYTIVHVRASNTGTETTAASTDGALTIGERDEEEDDVDVSAEGASLLQQHAATDRRGKGLAQEEVLDEIALTPEANPLQTPFSAMRPHASQLRPILVRGSPRGMGQDRGHVSQMMGLAAAASDPAAGSFVVPPGQKQAHIRFGPEPSPLKRSASEGSALHSLAHIAALQESAAPLSALAPPPKRYGRTSIKDTLTGKHPVQLSEWWADFDERVMRPVFNKPDAMGEWTPRAEESSTPAPRGSHPSAASSSSAMNKQPAAMEKRRSNAGGVGRP
ncbi:g1861 [Coccomyxa viridis]|uniref:G1861 protein n=1 Tax=Coccomyxa viridis TaxID=1274662 RepID=A0ABP1FL64_9CHLO